MKKLFLFLVAMTIATVNFAQNTLVATLTHGDDIKMFYGVNAFKDAHNAATSGDVINLSGGQFYAVDITKAVTVRGTGIYENNPTILTGNNYFDVSVPSSDSQRLTMEGIIIDKSCYMYISGNNTNPYFIRCLFHSIAIPNAPHAMFISCEISGNSLTNGQNTFSQFIGSYVESPSSGFDYINCVLLEPDCSSLKNSNLVNCILYCKNRRFYSLPISTVATNCVSVGEGNPFQGNTGPQNIYGLDKSIFIDSNYMNDLTDDAKAKYLGFDGTPVGMYGGMMPRNMTPSYPRITKMNVAKQTTADGKLSVEIEVSAAE